MGRLTKFPKMDVKKMEKRQREQRKWVAFTLGLFVILLIIFFSGIIFFLRISDLIK